MAKMHAFKSDSLGSNVIGTTCPLAKELMKAPINLLPSPLGLVLFYRWSVGYLPLFVCMRKAAYLAMPGKSWCMQQCM